MILDTFNLFTITVASKRFVGVTVPPKQIFTSYDLGAALDPEIIHKIYNIEAPFMEIPHRTGNLDSFPRTAKVQATSCYTLIKISNWPLFKLIFSDKALIKLN